jgi:DNA-binding SARP family transcriptional activator
MYLFLGQGWVLRQGVRLVLLLDSSVRFRILGSLEVNSEGRRVSVTAPKQKAVLAALVLDVNNFISIDRLTGYVWGECPPIAYQTTLQAYVYRLRRTLGQIPGVELLGGSAGYALEMDPAEIDLGFFRQKVGSARERVVNQNLEEAVADLRVALSVWRGSALAGVPGELLQQEACFLEGERLTAHEELVSAELLLGNHRPVIPELFKLVAAHPFRETLVAQLMLALYRSGRQAEALQSYSVARGRLREELGIEPGAELQELQTAILGRVSVDQIPAPS